eukprot:30443-Pelagococcus_subviridis.AAC.10
MCNASAADVKSVRIFPSGTSSPTREIVVVASSLAPPPPSPWREDNGNDEDVTSCEMSVRFDAAIEVIVVAFGHRSLTFASTASPGSPSPSRRDTPVGCCLNVT